MYRYPRRIERICKLLVHIVDVSKWKKGVYEVGSILSKQLRQTEDNLTCKMDEIINKLEKLEMKML